MNIVKSLGRPWCAQCERAVDELSMYRDEFRMEFVLIARCHGDTEVMRLDDRMFYAGPVIGLRCGTAFATRKLDNGGQQALRS